MISRSYQSPSESRILIRLENALLAADDSWWTGRHPLYTHITAEVPCALYLNYLANRSYAASLSPSRFRPLDLPGDHNTTLFTVLLFTCNDLAHSGHREHMVLCLHG